MNIFDIFKKAETAVAGWFQKATPVVENAFTGANGIVNILKSFLGSATGQTLEAVVETLAPGISTVIFNALNTFFADWGLIQPDPTKTLAQQAAEGLNKAAQLTGNSKIIALSNVAAIISHAIDTANGGTTTIQQALVANHFVYNSAVMGEPVTIVAPVTAQPTT